MIIHTVKPGDTVYNIAKANGVSNNRIIIDNDLTAPDKLQVGETLAITFPDKIYTIREGDSLFTIAREYGTTVSKLLQNNPQLKGSATVYPGQTLVISNTPSPPLGTISTNGYAYPFIENETLIRTLPYLTYLSVFTYGIRNDGTLIPPVGDSRLINAAKDYGTVPLMMLTSLTEAGTFSNELVNSILRDRELSDKVITEAVRTMKDKGYGGIDVDFEYISPEYAETYPDFLRRLKAEMGEDYILFASLAPKTDSRMRGLLYEGHDYGSVGDAADRVLLMTYEWGYTYSEPQAISPINKVREVVEYGTREIDPSKVFMGMPNYGYNWTLPYKKGVPAESLSNREAVNLAIRKNAEIQYDDISQSPFFTYFDKLPSGAVEHEVWFQNAKSYEALLRLASEFELDGVAIWNIMRYYQPLWTVLASLYNIRKK